MSGIYRLPIGDIVGQRWEVLRLIGEGGYGAVYEVRDRTDTRRTYALKVESNTAPPNERVLKMDEHILTRLRERAPEAAKNYFCGLFGSGKTTMYSYIVMTVVGKSLSDLRRRCSGKFSFRTAAHVAINSVLGLQALHTIDYLHRDVKPGNMAIGRPPNYRQCFILDFGLCRLFRHDDGRLRRPREKTGFKGTLRYASVACHEGEEMSRRDDLWSWLYMVVEMTLGSLAWQALMMEMRDKPLKEQIDKVGEMKKRLKTKPTVFMEGCPIEYLKIHQHLMTLGYFTEPDYQYILTLLRKMENRRRLATKDGEALDWEPGGIYHQHLAEYFNS